MSLEDELANLTQPPEPPKINPDFARMLWDYRNSLVDAGFTPDESFKIVRDWHSLYVENAMLGEAEPEPEGDDGPSP